MNATENYKELTRKNRALLEKIQEKLEKLASREGEKDWAQVGTQAFLHAHLTEILEDLKSI